MRNVDEQVEKVEVDREPVTSGVTLHLTAEAVWRAQANSVWYEPEAFAQDGFIHCTDGEQNVLDTGNRYYRGDPRPYVMLVIDIERVEQRVVYEDANRMFPHIYGRLNHNAVADVRSIERAHDGTFLSVNGTFEIVERHADITPERSPEE
jgi:uncharacterized protein (DUF952 family)